jgi:hypothetical protein
MADFFWRLINVPNYNLRTDRNTRPNEYTYLHEVCMDLDITSSEESRPRLKTVDLFHYFNEVLISSLCQCAELWHMKLQPCLLFPSLRTRQPLALPLRV